MIDRSPDIYIENYDPINLATLIFNRSLNELATDLTILVSLGHADPSNIYIV